MIPRFTSREIHFLKTDSDERTVTPPDTYWSDRLLTGDDSLKAFERRLEQADIPGGLFLCAVIEMATAPDAARTEDLRKGVETAFNLFLDNNRGIWESLDETGFILAFWDYENEAAALRTLRSLKEGLSRDGRQIRMGAAGFPCPNFPRAGIVANALKAADHAAFFPPGALVSFDGISLNICGDRLFQLHRYDLAVREYEEGLRLRPRDTNLLNSLGVCHAITGELGKAEHQFKAALKINPEELMVIYNIGLLHQINGNTEKAVQYLKKAHTLNGRVFEVELLLGQLLFKNNRFRQALPHLEAAMDLNPDSGAAFRIAGEIMLVRNRPDQAGPYFNTAIKRNPSDAAALSGYAGCLESQNKNLGIALTFARKSMDLEPDNPLFQERFLSIQEKIQGESTPENQMKTA